MYLGNQPALAYTSFAKQDFTTSATTSYILDNPVANENEIALFINFVRQEPTTAYTANGVNLTLTSATSASDDMYCVFLGKAVQTVNPPAGSVGTSQLEDASVTSAKLASGVLPTNTPAFSVYMTSNQSVTSATFEKVQFDAELFDTDGVFDNSTNYRFTVPSGQAGKYFLSTQLNFFSASNDVILTDLGLYKNGSLFQKNQMNAELTSNAQFRTFNVNLVTTMNLSVGDYIEIYGYVVGTSPLIIGNTEKMTNFSGYKLIGA